MKTSKKAPKGGASKVKNTPEKKTKAQEGPKKTNRLISEEDDDDFDIPLDDDLKGFDVFDDDDDDDYWKYTF